MRARAVIGTLALLGGLLSAATPASAAADPSRTPGTPSYSISLASDATGAAWTGRESVTFVNASPTPLAEVFLRLWDNAPAHGSCAAPPVVISNVTGGTAAAQSVNCTAQRIALPAPLAQNATATIGFNLRISVPPGVDRFGRDGAFTFVGNALPVLAVLDAKGWHLDPYTNNGESFYGVISDYDVSLDHPTSLLTPATGTSVDTAGAAGRTVTRASAKNVREFAWAAGPFRKITGRSPGGVAVNVYSVSNITTAQAQSMLTVSTSALDAHSSRFGAYPYGEADVVLDNGFFFGGMEYPGFVLDRVSSTALAHELAHQWFYGIVGNDEYNDPWLDEGFTDYATDLFNNVAGTNCGITWQSTAERLTNSMAYWDAHANRYGTVIYSFGKCTLHDLRRLIGTTAMTNLMKSYAQSHWYGISTVADFKAAAQAAAGGVNLTAFWTQHRVG